eukprot:m.311855 g.311855  ORF g.311855 m.311855 type:complete len:87 (+) comp55373_c0_seq1:2052-2312(+)
MLCSGVAWADRPAESARHGDSRCCAGSARWLSGPQPDQPLDGPPGPQAPVPAVGCLLKLKCSLLRFVREPACTRWRVDLIGRFIVI